LEVPFLASVFDDILARDEQPTFIPRGWLGHPRTPPQGPTPVCRRTRAMVSSRRTLRRNRISSGWIQPRYRRMFLSIPPQCQQALQKGTSGYAAGQRAVRH
jgi:hypothetical protein